MTAVAGVSTTLVDKPKILLIPTPAKTPPPCWAGLADSHESVMVQNPMRALALLTREKFAGVYVTAKFFREAFEIGKLLQNEQILEGMPDGVVLLEGDNTILWGNGRICEWSGRESVRGVNFFTALGSPEILGPDFCPFHTALATGQSTSSTLRGQDNRYFQVHAAPMRELSGPAAPPDRHRPRRDQRSAPAAEARGHPPGRHGAGRPDARGTLRTCRSRTASSC